MDQTRLNRVHDSRFVFAAALVAGTSYWPASHLVAQGALLVLWKGAGVTFLALWAAMNARTTSGCLIVAVLVAGALGDVLLELAGQTVGAFFFLVGHLTAIVLYRRHSRAIRDPLVLAVMVIVMGLAWWLTHAPLVMIYAAGLGGMVGSAIASRFPLVSVGLGSVMFALSDLLLFAKHSIMKGSVLPAEMIWPLYLGGQALIAFGVVTDLKRDA